jgi:hypothetical protein
MSSIMLGQIISYRTSSARARQITLIIRTVFGVAFLGWGVVAVGFYGVFRTFGDEDRIMVAAMDAAFSTILGAIVASPVFGAAFLLRRWSGRSSVRLVRRVDPLASDEGCDSRR